MKLAIVGTGRMGSAVESLAEKHGHSIAARFNSAAPLTGAAGPEALQGADVAVDFTLPTAVLANLKLYARWRQPAVVGTTGWYDRLPEVARWVGEGGSALLYAPNFSLGVQVMVQGLRAVARLIDRLPEYDVTVHETHHARKVDRPSGTALHIGNILLDAVSRKRQSSVEGDHALEITSSRIGTVFGEHTVRLESPADRIKISHEAKGRQGFALGALRAAEWLQGRTGVYTLEDMFEDWLSGQTSQGARST